METPERPPLVRRKFPGQWQMFNDIAGAIDRVAAQSDLVLRAMGPMRWRTCRVWNELSSSHETQERVQDWPVHVHHEARYDFNTRQARAWWRRIKDGRDLHPAVKAVLQDDWKPDHPDGLDTIVLEWPCHSTDMRLAYVQSEDKGKADRWTVTTAGKYLKSRWSYLDDHYIRDVVSRTASLPPTIWHEPQEIVRAVQFGPRSCMQWDDDEIRAHGYEWYANEDGPAEEFWVHNHELHPYAVYAPEFGWRMAVRLEENAIKARALVLHHSRGPHVPGEELKGSIYVRSYRKSCDGYSPADEALEAWLDHMGVAKCGEWPLGTKMARVTRTVHGRRTGLLMPYIDGGNQTVTDEGDYVRLSRRGILCTNQDGSADNDDRIDCSDCGEQADADEGIYVGVHGDTWVCECCSDNYTRVTGRNRSEYYVHEDNAVLVDDERYHDDYLGDNDIVQLEDGDYCHTDYAFCCPIDDCWYSTDDGRHTEDEGMVHESNAWQCCYSDEWYSTNTDFVVVDGEKYHPDNAPEDEEVEPGSPFDLPYEKPEGSIPNEAQLPLRILPDPEPPTQDMRTIYAHPTSAGLGCRYRAGEDGTIDVWNLHRDGVWTLNVGDQNDALLDLAKRYYPCPLPELETT